MEQATQTELTMGATVTEIEIYDTTLPIDPTTGVPPIKARVKQRSNRKAEIKTNARSAATASSELKTDALTDSASNYTMKGLDELVVTASRTSSIWDRVKQGAAWATAIIILVAVGRIIYKLKKW